MKATHPLIRKTAEEMAATWYEDAAHHNHFYKAYPKQARFVARHWLNFLGQARSALAQLLAQNISEAMKEEIFEALILERTLPGSITKALPPVLIH